MLAHFRIVSAVPLYPGCFRWPPHDVTLSNGNVVMLDWNETESADCRDEYGRWMPRPPQAGDTLIVDENGVKLAVLTENLWRWLAMEDRRKI